MINAKIDEGNVAISIRGSLRDIMAECILLVRNIYERIDETDKE